MTQADTPMPGEDPGALIEDEDRLDEIEPAPRGDPAGSPPAGPAPAAEGEMPGASAPERQRA